MDFNTTLNSNVSYNRPVETPSVFGVIASTLAQGVSSVGPERQLSQDEMFAQTLKSYQDNNPALRSTDPSIRSKAIKSITPEFLVNNPEYVSQFKGWSESLGVTIEVPVEQTAKDATDKARDAFIQTPIGQVAQANAMATASKTGIFDENTYIKNIDEARLTRNQTLANLDLVKSRVDLTKAASDQADVYYKSSTIEAQKTVSSVMIGMEDILNRIAKGETVDLAKESPELASQIRVSQVNSTNISTVLQAVRPFLVSSINNQLIDTFVEAGIDPNTFTSGPTKDVTDQWMSGYDALITTAGSEFGSVSAALKTFNDTDQLAALNSLNSNQRSALAIVNVVPTELRLTIVSSLEDRFSLDQLKGPLSKLELNAASNRPITDIVADIDNGSVADANVTLSAGMEYLGSGKLEGTQFTQTLTTTLAANAKVTKNASLGTDTYKKVFIDNAETIKTQASADPQFSNYVAGEVLSDINKTLEAAKISGVSSQLNVDIIAGKVVVSLTENAKAGYAIAGGMGGGGAVVAPPIENLYTPEIKALQLKLNSLEQLGDVGKEVMSAFNIGQTEPSKLAQPESYFTFDKALVPATGEVVKIGQAEIVTNKGMKPLLNSMEGASNLTVKGADKVMEGMLQGPFQKLQTTFGSPLTINDGIAKGGTSREKETKGSRHFHGDALDIDTSGMSDQEKLKLVDSAIASGFQGFGFGNNILHVDLGAKRAWAYGNTTFGGESIANLKNKVGSASIAAAVVNTDPREPKVIGDIKTPETDPTENKPTEFSLLSSFKPEQQTQFDSMGNPTGVQEQDTQQTVVETPTATSAAPTVGKEAQALVSSLGEPDATFTTNEEFLAASSAGKFTAGDVILVDGVTYVIRKDGTPVKVGG
jgi:hypothetical protein